MSAGTEAHVFISLPGVLQSERRKPEIACCQGSKKKFMWFFFVLKFYNDLYLS